MRLTALATRPIFATLLLLLTTAGCRDGADRKTLVWKRADLWALPVAGKTPGRLTVHLGPAAAHDLPETRPQLREAAPAVSAGQIRAIEQLEGQPLRYALALGQEPYLSFIPLRNELHNHRLTYRVAVEPSGGGERVELLTLIGEEELPNAAAATIVDLTPYAGKSIDLILELTAPAGRQANRRRRGLWGSPAVWSRHPATPPEPQPASAAVTPAPPASGRPNVLLIGADTLRADALGAWGANPSYTPALDRLAAESDVWLDAYSCFNVTNPSFASIMTGLYGKHHGVYGLRTPLAANASTLAESFSSAGYDTLAVISARHLGDHNSGLGQGFGQVALSDGQYSAELAVDTTLDWLAAREGASVSPNSADRSPGASKLPSTPFFAWLHLFDPHTPHTPPLPYALGYTGELPFGLSPVKTWKHFRDPGPVAYRDTKLRAARQLYAGEVAYLDRQVDRLLGFLDSRLGHTNTIVVFVSDHGENLENHGIEFRHAGLFETTTHVPLMIRWPGPNPTGRVMRGLVQTHDLFATLLAATNLPIPPNDGEDLRVLTAAGRSGRRAVFADHADQLGATVRTRTHRYMVSIGNPFLADGPYLYDLTADPSEVDNLAGQGLSLESELGRLLSAWQNDRRQTLDPQRDRELSDEERKRLEALGYV